MDAQATVIILCAGVGSRMGLAADINKCAADLNGTSAIAHTVAAFKACGVTDIALVVGHAAQSVRRAIAKRGLITRFIQNDKYNIHGCNYSVACGVTDALTLQARRVIIAEGDSLLHPDSIAAMVNANQPAAALVRSPDYVSFARSVTAIGVDGSITRYAYNQDHTDQPPAMDDNEIIIGESMQVWSFSQKPLDNLRRLLREYKNTADGQAAPMSESGVFSINEIAEPISPIRSSRPEHWINLNTAQDIKKAREQQWLLR
jgi:NDP-sugar pyrophosphorylase family protein